MARPRKIQPGAAATNAQERETIKRDLRRAYGKQKNLHPRLKIEADAEVMERKDFDTEIAKFTPRQMMAVKALGKGLDGKTPAKFVLYGGARGGGKSYLARWWCIRRLIQLAGMGYHQPVGTLCSEDYPSLKDRQLQRISAEVPLWMGRMFEDHRSFGRCLILSPQFGGGVLKFRNLDDPSKWQGGENCFIALEEATKQTYQTFTLLRTTLRWPAVPIRRVVWVRWYSRQRASAGGRGYRHRNSRS